MSKKHYKIIAICQIYNELEKNNLKRFIENVKPLVDALVIYDDGSTDGSYDYALKHTQYIIRGKKNSFKEEIFHKKLLLQKAIDLKADFILWLNADEVLSANAKNELQTVCAYADKNNIDAITFHQINLWRSKRWYRIDSFYDKDWFVRLWRVKPGLYYDTKPGLHQQQYPQGIEKIESNQQIKVIHYGFSTEENIAWKYFSYKLHGQSLYLLNILIEEENLQLKKMPQSIIPKKLLINENKPKKRSFIQVLDNLGRYRNKKIKFQFNPFIIIENKNAFFLVKTLLAKFNSKKYFLIDQFVFNKNLSWLNLTLLFFSIFYKFINLTYINLIKPYRCLVIFSDSIVDIFASYLIKIFFKIPVVIYSDKKLLYEKSDLISKIVDLFIKYVLRRVDAFFVNDRILQKSYYDKIIFSIFQDFFYNKPMKKQQSDEFIRIFKHMIEII